MTSGQWKHFLACKFTSYLHYHKMSCKCFSLTEIVKCLCNWTNRPRQHHCSSILWWRNYTMHIHTVRCIQKKPQKHWTSKSPYHFFWSVLSKCLPMFEPAKQVSKALNADDNLAGHKKQTPYLPRKHSRGSQLEKIACVWVKIRVRQKEKTSSWDGRACTVWGGRRTNRALIAHLPLSERFATWSQGCDQNDWNHNRSSNCALYLRSIWANIKTVGNIFLSKLQVI